MYISVITKYISIKCESSTLKLIYINTYTNGSTACTEGFFFFERVVTKCFFFEDFGGMSFVFLLWNLQDK